MGNGDSLKEVAIGKFRVIYPAVAKQYEFRDFSDGVKEWADKCITGLEEGHIAHIFRDMEMAELEDLCSLIWSARENHQMEECAKSIYRERSRRIEMATHGKLGG
jgi:hypothetical protein